MDQSVHLNNCCPSRLRRVWQKRKCSVKNGFLTIWHGTVRCHFDSSALLPSPAPSYCMSKKSVSYCFQRGNTRSDFSVSVICVLIVSFLLFPPFILKFLHEESNGQSGQSLQQRKRKRRRRSIRKRMSERRVLGRRGRCLLICTASALIGHLLPVRNDANLQSDSWH